MDSHQSGNDSWTALDGVPPKWAHADPKVLETLSKSKSFSLTETLDHSDIKHTHSDHKFFTDPALFGISAAKLLAFRSPEPGSSQELDFVLGDFSEIQDWITIYLKEKIASLSAPTRPLSFDPKVPFVLLQILDNVYDVAKSLVNFFVETAVENAKERLNRKVEVEDFACVDYDFILSSLNPLRCKFGYRLNDISDLVFGEDSICRACGKPRDPQTTKPTTVPSRKRKPARKPVKKETPASISATPSSLQAQTSSHAESISQMVKPAPNKARRMSVRQAHGSVQHESNPTLSQVGQQPATDVPKAEPESDPAFLAHANVLTTAAAGPPNCSLTNSSFTSGESLTAQPTASGSSLTSRAIGSGLPRRSKRSSALPSSTYAVDRKGKRKARTESPAMQNVDDDAEALLLMPPPEGLPPFHDPPARPPSTSGLKFKLPRPSGVVGQATTPGTSSARTDDTVVNMSPPANRSLQRRMSE